MSGEEGGTFTIGDQLTITFANGKVETVVVSTFYPDPDGRGDEIFFKGRAFHLKFNKGSKTWEARSHESNLGEVSIEPKLVV